MIDQPLYVAILWHMHQPYYRDLLTGEIALPWVRMHAAEDYLHMGTLLSEFPKVHLTINMVPSLTEQMLAWSEGREQDELIRLAEQTAWNSDEQRAILNLCFSVSWDNIIRRYPRYAELLDRRLAALADPGAFTPGDYRDLLAWFNLAWIDPNWLEQDPDLRALVARGRDFTIDDLQLIHGKQRTIAGCVAPLYRKLAESGQLELSTSPFYHPILPLLIDNGLARHPSPALPLPELMLRAPEDALNQLRNAVDAHTRHFGRPPRGLWPSEGAVSLELLELANAAGFHWIASDEAVLGRSIGRTIERDGNLLPTTPQVLYQPYRAMSGTDLGPAIVFRDHELSDRIGFLYQRFPAQQAAEDMVYRLLEIRKRMAQSGRPHLVSIILDGENCWEHYEHNGDPFLRALYGQLSTRPELQAVSVSEYLAQHAAGGTLARLATGSWIRGDLTTWIGDPEHSRAWEALARTRAYLVRRASRPGTQGVAAAWEALYVAEGSDWFWWYSHRNRSDQDAYFDRLFRHDLSAVYRALGDEPPRWLQLPIYQALPVAGGRSAAGYTRPALTAAPHAGGEWALAATVLPASSSGTMQRADSVIERLFVGHDEHTLYLRVELRDRVESYRTAIYLKTPSDDPVNQRTRAQVLGHQHPAQQSLGWEVEVSPGQTAPFLYRADGRDHWVAVGPLAGAVSERVVEAAVPFQLAGLSVTDTVDVLVTATRENEDVAVLPEEGMREFVLMDF